MKLGLEGKVAIVTGGARGIGFEICFQLAREGMDIYIFDVRKDEAFAAAQDINNETGRKVISVYADIRSEEHIKEAFGFIENENRVYALINNAGITKDGFLMRMKEEDIDSVIDINLKAAIKMSKYAMKDMLKEKQGRIVNISSVAGLIGNAGQTNYAASKAGLIGFTKSLARELGPRGITVNAVAPGFVMTQMTESLSEEVKQDYLKKIPLGYFSEPKDVANLVSFLLSENARYITGEVIRIDGGLGM